MQIEVTFYERNGGNIMQKLTIKEIINNLIDELSRARELLADNQEAQESMLISDIDSELDRVSDLDERIDFAMLMSSEIGDVSIPTIDKIYELESKTELPYENGMVDTETVYNTLGDITATLKSEIECE